MSNQLKMAKIDAILALRQRKWSIRRIAMELGVSRDTVARHIRASARQPNQGGAPLGVLGDCDEAKQASPEAGAQSSKQATPEGAPIGSKQATPEGAPIGSAAPKFDPSRQASRCEAWRQIILDKLQLGLTAQRIFQDLVSPPSIPACAALSGTWATTNRCPFGAWNANLARRSRSISARAFP